MLRFVGNAFLMQKFWKLHQLKSRNFLQKSFFAIVAQKVAKSVFAKIFFAIGAQKVAKRAMSE